MSTFRLSAYLATPIALGNTFLTLDAVLFGILSELKELGVSSLDPVESIPIASIDGLFLASGAQFTRPVTQSEIKIGGIRPVRDMADATRFITPSSRGAGRIAKIDTNRGPHKAHLSRYRIVAAEAVWWLAEGDGQAAKRLIEDAGSIGALRKDGHGQIARVTVEAASVASVLTDEMGNVTRPIPVSLAPVLGLVPGAMRTVETWRPPYWSTENRAECMIPAV